MPHRDNFFRQVYAVLKIMFGPLHDRYKELISNKVLTDSQHIIYGIVEYFCNQPNQKKFKKKIGLNIFHRSTMKQLLPILQVPKDILNLKEDKVKINLELARLELKGYLQQSLQDFHNYFSKKCIYTENGKKVKFDVDIEKMIKNCLIEGQGKRQNKDATNRNQTENQTTGITQNNLIDLVNEASDQNQVLVGHQQNMKEQLDIIEQFSDEDSLVNQRMGLQIVDQSNEWLKIVPCANTEEKISFLDWPLDIQ